MAAAGLTGEGLGEPGSARSGGSGPVAAQSGPGMGSAGLCGGRVLGRRRGGGGGDVAAQPMAMRQVAPVRWRAAVQARRGRQVAAGKRASVEFEEDAAAERWEEG